MTQFTIDNTLKVSELNNGQRVLVHSFGDNYTCLGTIKGLIGEHITRFYIVELDKPNPWAHPWDSISVPQGCLSPIIEYVTSMPSMGYCSSCYGRLSHGACKYRHCKEFVED